MAIITALKIQQKNKNRINIFLDGEFAFGLSLTAALELKKGQTLSQAEIAQLQREDETQQAYERAIRYLSYRARSQQEVQRYLQGKGFGEAAIEAAIDRLSADNYLDDAAFAQLWVADRKRTKPRSGRALGYELRQKGISQEIIETVLEDINEERLAWEAVEPKLRQWQSLDRQALQKKVMGFLSRRGFNYDVMRQVYERAWEMMND